MIETVPPLAVVAMWVTVTVFVLVAYQAPTVEPAAVAFVGVSVQVEEVVTPGIVVASEVAVVYSNPPVTICRSGYSAPPFKDASIL